MKTFEPRLTAPLADNKYYINTTYGGYNRYMVMNKKSGTVLPNCCAYAYGRFMEEADMTECLLPWSSNAENWFSYSWGDNYYAKGQEPKLGAVGCWRKGRAGYAKDGEGHVGIVEVVENGKVTFSMSAYGGQTFYKRTFTKSSYNYNGMVFQGFIYNPNVIEPVKPTKTIDEVAQEVIKGLWGNGETRKARLTAEGYNYDEVQARVNEILAKQNALKVGDSVKIINYGNAQANGKGKKAYGYGWTRQILKIHEGAEYPYQVGNKLGTTGFYKKEALKKI